MQPSLSNPFKAEKKLGRLLIMAERDRELTNLQTNLVRLKQKQATGEVFLTGLSN